MAYRKRMRRGRAGMRRRGNYGRGRRMRGRNTRRVRAPRPGRIGYRL